MNHSAITSSGPTTQSQEPSACISPLPWSLWGEPNPQQVITSKDGFVAQTLHANDYANAAFIVRACNAHDDLVAALERILRSFEADAEQVPFVSIATCWATNSQAIAQARAALAKART